MSEYRYYTADLLTEAVIAEMPLFGVQADSIISSAGVFTGSFLLGTGIFLDDSLLEGSEPGKVALYMERDGTLIWGGIVWSRKYDASTKQMDITALEFESYFDHVVIETNFVKQSVGMYQIFKDLVDLLQLQDGCDLNFITSGINVSHPSSILRTSLIPAYEYHYAADVVQDLITPEDGFDYVIDVVPSGIQDKPLKVLRVGYPLLGVTVQESTLTFDYPGNIDTYTWTESATNAGVKFGGIGAGSGSKMLRADTVDSDLRTAGYPSWWYVKANKDLGTQAEVNKYAAALRQRYRMPVGSPTFELKADRIPMFDAWNDLGAQFQVYIEDARFPDGKTINSRFLAWSLTPAENNRPETLKLTIEGVDD